MPKKPSGSVYISPNILPQFDGCAAVQIDNYE